MSNCTPKKDTINKTATFTYTPPSSGEGISQPVTLTFDYVDKDWYEVRPPTGKSTITNAQKKEKLETFTTKIPAGEDSNGDIIFTNQVFTQQKYDYDNGVSTPVFERYCRADYGYDEQYFYHIFEWPFTHTSTRTAGGFVATTSTSTSTEGGTVSTTTYSVESAAVTANLTLGKVDSQILYNGSTTLPNGIIAYHGGTDDNKIFFFYESTDNKEMIAVGDVINGWTVNKVVNYNSEYIDGKPIRTSEVVSKRVSKSSKSNKTPGFIYVNKNDTSESRIINLGDEVIGNGIQKGTTVVGIDGLKITLSLPLKYKRKEKVRNVSFKKTDLVNNISQQTLCYAEISGGSQAFVADQFYAKGTPSTPQLSSTVYHVFNDYENENTQLTTTKEIKVVAKSKGDEGGTSDTTNRKHYEVTFLDNTTITNSSDVQIIITDDRTASGVEKSFNFVSKIEVVNTKTFRVWFKRNDNKVNTYVRGWKVNRVVGGAVIASNRIKVVAGKGIIHRSAVVGVYMSDDKKFYSYSPLFYSKDNFCEPTYAQNDLGKFLVGDVTLTDGSIYINDKFLCIEPSDDYAYQINDIFWTYFNRPAEQSELQYWVDKLKSSNFLVIQKEIIASESAKMGSRKVVSVKDSECDNTISPNYSKVYFPYQEIETFNEYLQPIQDNAQYDECVDIKSSSPYTVEEVRNAITTNLESSLNFSSVNLPEEMYKRIISNPDSLQNTLLNAMKTISTSIPKQTTIPNVGSRIEGEDKSSKQHLTENGFRIPPRFKNIEYIIEDFSFVSDNALNSEADENKVTITLKSIPRWGGTVTSGGVTGDSINSGNGLQITTNRTSGYIDTINISAGTFSFNTGGLGGGFGGGFGGLGPTSSKSWVGGSPYPSTMWHGADVNYQVSFEKLFNFRVFEVSNIIANAVENKGNPYMPSPPYAKLTEDLNSADTVVKVNSTSEFLTSGYLIIPKFIIKIEVNPETKNETLYHYYLGEEIVYYRDKTETEFKQCTRQMFNTTNQFEESANSGQIISGATYIIKAVGSVNWKLYGAPDGYSVGTIFTATRNGSGQTESGEVYLFESNFTPFPNSPTPTHSYQKGNYISQFWPIEIQNK